MLRSLTMRSELLTLTGASELTDYGPYVVQTTPTEPDFWMGNQLILKDTRHDRDTLLKLFERHFPTASHRAMVWDIPNLAESDLPTGLAKRGLQLESVDALLLSGPLRAANVPAGITIRPISSEVDWAAVLDLQDEIGIEEGYDQPTHRAYLEGRNRNRRAQIAKGLGQWFGAFDGDLLVSQMGLFHDADVARYQAVETRVTHRKRGIASALLRHAAVWALDRAPRAKVIIVARMESDAGRLYRAMGFEHAETIHGVVRAGV